MKKRLFTLSALLLAAVITLGGCNYAENLLDDFESALTDRTTASTPIIVAEKTEAETSGSDAEESSATPETKPAESSVTEKTQAQTYTFRNADYYEQHYQKHGAEFGSITKEEYLRLANELINNPDALTKYEEDGDLCYYDEAKNEFLVLSGDGYIRTFFRPDSGIDYFNRQ